MKQKIEPPKTEAPKDKPLTELTPEEVETKLADFQEALKDKKFEGIDIYKAIGLEKPPEVNPDEEAKKVKIEDLTKTYNDTVNSLKELGVDLTPKPEASKMSEADKEIAKKVEKQGQAKFAEQKSELLKIDEDYPIEEIENLDLPVEEKLVVMAVQKEITQRNIDAIKKIKDELDNVVREQSEVKMGAPAQEKTGADKVKAAMAKFGLKEEVTDEPSNTDTGKKPDPDKTE